jgi:hypothetical protein
MLAGTTSGSTDRVRLNVGGRLFETTAATLLGDGKHSNFFTSLLKHSPRSSPRDSPRGNKGSALLDVEPKPPDDPLFIDRDGDAFGPILNFMRTGALDIPPSVSETAVRQEADFYCVSLPSTEVPREVRCDGLYLSFGEAKGGKEEDHASGGPSGTAEGEVRAYLHFNRDSTAVLGRREANGQWSAVRCRYSSLAGALLLVHSLERARPGTPEENAAEGNTRSAEAGEPQLELSAVVIDSDFIEVITCARVGRLENPFHFVPSAEPAAGSAFISHVAPPGPGRTAAGRVVLAFEDHQTVGVMVTSSQPGWSAASASRFRAQLGRRGGGAETFASSAESREVADALCHLSIDNGNFTRTFDFVSLGERGLVEFVQLNAQHEPQAIWYRPLGKRTNPWA